MRTTRNRLALAAAVVLPIAVTAVLVPFRTHLANTDAALVLVAVVVAVAAYGNRWAGYSAALVAAFAFDFFLTSPYQSLKITHSQDIETTVLVVVIGVAVTELGVWGRRQHATAARRAGYLAGIHAAAQATVGDANRSTAIDRVSSELRPLLGLQSCQFQHGVAGLGSPARLHHDGTVTVNGRLWPVDDSGLPGEVPLELLLQRGSVLQGRFLMQPAPGSHPDLEQRLVAVALADQLSSTLG